jgi:chromosomal replication initiator protein
MLQGALIRLMAHASLHGTTPTPELARRVLAREAGGRALGPATIPGIQAATAVEFGVPAASLTAKDRRPHVALARQVAMYLARELTDDSLPAIGAAFGGRNHSTVLHAHRKVARQIENDDASGARITGLATSLAGPDRRE